VKVICKLAEECIDMGCRHRLPHEERGRDVVGQSPCDGYCLRNGADVRCDPIGDEEDIA